MGPDRSTRGHGRPTRTAHFVDRIPRPTRAGRSILTTAYRSSLFARALLPAAVFSTPEFFVIGAQKAGTTALFSALRQHPDVRLPVRKELHLLEKEECSGLTRRAHRAAFPLRRGSGWVTGEATPFMARPWMPERLAGMYPDAKLIAVLRDPVDRLLSHYDHLSRLHGEARSLDEMVQSEMGSRARSPHSWGSNSDDLVIRSMYRLLLARWTRHFPTILLVESSTLESDEHTSVPHVEEWLGVQPRERLAAPRLNASTAEQQMRRTDHDIPTAVRELLDRERDFWTTHLSDGVRVWTAVDSARSPGPGPGALADAMGWSASR